MSYIMMQDKICINVLNLTKNVPKSHFVANCCYIMKLLHLMANIIKQSPGSTLGCNFLWAS